MDAAPCLLRRSLSSSYLCLADCYGYAPTSLRVPSVATQLLLLTSGELLLSLTPPLARSPTTLTLFCRSTTNLFRKNLCSRLFCTASVFLSGSEFLDPGVLSAVVLINALLLLLTAFAYLPTCLPIYTSYQHVGNKWHSNAASYYKGDVVAAELEAKRGGLPHKDTLPGGRQVGRSSGSGARRRASFLAVGLPRQRLEPERPGRLRWQERE